MKLIKKLLISLVLSIVFIIAVYNIYQPPNCGNIEEEICNTTAYYVELGIIAVITSVLITVSQMAYPKLIAK